MMWHIWALDYEWTAEDRCHLGGKSQLEFRVPTPPRQTPGGPGVAPQNGNGDFEVRNELAGCDSFAVSLWVIQERTYGNWYVTLPPSSTACFNQRQSGASYPKRASTAPFSFSDQISPF